MGINNLRKLNLKIIFSVDTQYWLSCMTMSIVKVKANCCAPLLQRQLAHICAKAFGGFLFSFLCSWEWKMSQFTSWALALTQRGEVAVCSNENYLTIMPLVSLWINALHWEEQRHSILKSVKISRVFASHSTELTSKIWSILSLWALQSSLFAKCAAIYILQGIIVELEKFQVIWVTGSVSQV